MIWLTVLLAAAATALVPPGSSHRRLAAFDRSAASPDGPRRAASGRRRWQSGRAADRAQAARLLATVTDVAAALRAGEAPAVAWRSTGVLVGPDGVPTTSALAACLGLTPAPDRSLRCRRTTAGAGSATERQLSAVVAATRLAVDLGAPLAPVLDRCASTLAADQESEAELAAALAGPGQTTRLLTWLPALGLVAGTLLGAAPVQVLLSGGPGSLAALVGAALALAGRAWVRRMVAGARRVALGSARPVAGRLAATRSGPARSAATEGGAGAWPC